MDDRNEIQRFVEDGKFRINVLFTILIVVLVYKAYTFGFVLPDISNNNSQNIVKLEKCIDGDTAQFSEIGKTRFLLIDTPESTTKIEPYGKAASSYTCDLLSKAKTITYEYDGNKKDRYNRTLAYIFVDGNLIQELIAKEGYVKKFYLYKSNYKYYDKVYKSVNDKYYIFEK